MCKHNSGFTHIAWDFKECALGAWVCNLNCGFALNFNPEDFENSIAYVVKDNTKPGPHLLSEGKSR